jgi:ABC-2 type transport system permease protein
MKTRLSKYIQIVKTSWANGFVYRFNFIMWRVRSVIQLLVVYFLWLAIFKEGGTIASYDKQTMLTYILGTAVLRSFVLGSRSIDIGQEIASGDLSNYLIKPLNYFANWLSRDFADKALNLIFVVVELTILVFILKPTLVLQSQFFYISSFFIAAVLAMLIYFFLSFLISSITFWYPEHDGWPARFLASVIIEFLSGGLFPLDIFPQAAFKVLRLLPPAYFLFYPLQVYLGRLSVQEVFLTIAVMVIWLGLLIKTAQLVWHKGLKTYAAYGR